MSDIGKETPKKVYVTFDLIRLTYKLVHKNLNTILKCLLRGVLLTIAIGLVALIPMSIVMAGIDVPKAEILHEVSQAIKAKESILDTLGVDAFMVFMIVVIRVALSICVAIWLIVKTVVSIDTGIETIESKKVNVSTSNTFLKMLITQIIAGVVLVTISFLMRKEPPIIYMIIFTIVGILMFLIDQIAIFSYFEVMAKGNNVRDSIYNATVNLFFSKNELIIKSVAGILLILIAYILFALMIVGGGALLVIMLLSMNSTFLAILVGILALIIFIVLTWYYTFFGIMYNYLAYMLNRVIDVKIEKLK